MSIIRTEVTPNIGHVVVRPTLGEFLHYSLACLMPIPIFSQSSDVKGVLRQAPDFTGHPLPLYEWDYLKNPSDIQQLEGIGLRMSFLTAPRPAPGPHYTYRLEKRSATSAILSVVFEIQFTGDPTDIADEFFTVVIQ